MKPKITVIIPAYKEEKIIEKTIRHLFNTTYTDFEVIVGVSTNIDRTVDIVEELAKEFNNLRLNFTEHRRSPTLAISDCLKEAEGQIIVKSDADIYYINSDWLFMLEDYFKDEKIGGVVFNWEAVTPDILKERDESLLASGEIFVNCLVADFRRDNYQEVANNYNLPLTCDAFRKDLVDYLPDVISDDGELAYKILIQSHKVVFADDIKKYSVGFAKSVHDLFFQKRRTSLGWLQIAPKYKVNINRYYLELLSYFLKSLNNYSFKEIFGFFVWLPVYICSVISALIKSKTNFETNKVWGKYERKI